jgi:hypothetical protein
MGNGGQPPFSKPQINAFVKSTRAGISVERRSPVSKWHQQAKEKQASSLDCLAMECAMLRLKSQQYTSLIKEYIRIKLNLPKGWITSNGSTIDFKLSFTSGKGFWIWKWNRSKDYFFFFGLDFYKVKTKVRLFIVPNEKMQKLVDRYGGCSTTNGYSLCIDTKNKDPLLWQELLRFEVKECDLPNLSL